MILLALTSFTFADTLTFTGHGDTFGPPFPTDSIALTVRNDAGTPLQALYITIPTASPDSGLNLSITSGGPTAHFNTANLENYDFPGRYAQRFDGLDPSGNHDQSSVLSQIFTSSSFEALIQFDLPPDAPEGHLYYLLRGRIGEGQPITFSSVYVIPSPQGYFDLDLSFSPTGPLSSDPVVQIDLLGSTTPFPEPSICFPAAIVALLAAPRRIRYHLRASR
ncbi:MAG TPA: hypothetical protein VGP99_01790 [Tepidisphaeraceae bacterium]|nr:hypothetical protein [Tepidisphaeraceae bacterium]